MNNDEKHYLTTGSWPKRPRTFGQGFIAAIIVLTILGLLHGVL